MRNEADLARTCSRAAISGAGGRERHSGWATGDRDVRTESAPASPGYSRSAEAHRGSGR
jgi:hypothetical protein